MIDTKELRSMVDAAHFESLANFVIGSLLDRLEAAETAWKLSEKSLYDMTEKVIPNLRDQLEAAEVERGSYKVAYEEWIEKTEWVQRGINDGTIPLKYLGWHRGDIVADLLSVAEKERDHEKWLRERAEDYSRAVEDQRDALRARIEAMGRQEPVAWMSSRNGFICKDNKNTDYNVPLIIAPGAQGE